MAEPHAHSQPIQTYGRAAHNRLRNAWPILLFALVAASYPLLVVLVLVLVLKHIFQVLVLVLVLGGQVLVLILVLGGVTSRRSLSWSLGSGPCPCPSLWGSGPCPCPWGSGPC